LNKALFLRLNRLHILTAIVESLYEHFSSLFQNYLFLNQAIKSFSAFLDFQTCKNAIAEKASPLAAKIRAEQNGKKSYTFPNPI